ncbi:ferric-dicitrate binding protein FerR (iron transport regulator) [Pedobacter sp. AK013]|uniref:FecR family protein n=1 Tax=Pedobacter sp. AK013 TaxID=2723071 RepID=UPI00161673F1|nr:FecR family protein [Pedobacter sp. AK013]MBB6236855.1 ferric-dicitrate binding protein FerR (iron transport regulator) [Pedobacter sp. AK013]
MEQKDVEQLKQKLILGELTEPEQQDFFNWLKQLDQPELNAFMQEYSALFEQKTDSLAGELHERLTNQIEMRLDALEAANTPFWKRSAFKLMAAAAVLVLACSSIFLYYSNLNGHTQTALSKSTTIPHAKAIYGGSDKVLLILSNGKRIEVNNFTKGQLAVENGYSIEKESNNLLKYRKINTIIASAPGDSNTIVTPRGGQYCVNLPDGSKVWLNAESKLTYPVAFSGNIRKIALQGEAYFEVTHNPDKPFIVCFKGSNVKVLGTHFNICAYNDGETPKTTLLQGSVEVSTGDCKKIILPGQQAISSHNIAIVNIDTNHVMGWKNGNFSFEHERIGTVMGKISRWYDVDVKYQGEVTQEEFVGSIPKSKNLEEVLHRLELTGLLHFKIRGRSVTIMP